MSKSVHAPPPRQAAETRKFPLTDMPTGLMGNLTPADVRSAHLLTPPSAWSAAGGVVFGCFHVANSAESRRWSARSAGVVRGVPRPGWSPCRRVPVGRGSTVPRTAGRLLEPHAAAHHATTASTKTRWSLAARWDGADMGNPLCTRRTAPSRYSENEEPP